MTKFQLATSLFSPITHPVNVTINGYTGKVLDIKMEDGGGSSFNVTLLVDGPCAGGSTEVAVYVRTVD